MFYYQFERYFHIKIIVTMIPADLGTNSNLVIFITDLVIFFLSFLTSQKQESGFQQVDGLVTKNICFLFMASRALFQNHAEFNRLL